MEESRLNPMPWFGVCEERSGRELRVVSDRSKFSKEGTRLTFRGPSESKDLTRKLKLLRLDSPEGHP